MRFKLHIISIFTLLILFLSFEVRAQNHPDAGGVTKLCSSSNGVMATVFSALSVVPIIGDYIGPPRMVLGPIIKPYGMSGNIVRCVQTVVNYQGAKLITSYVWFFGPIVMYAAMIAILLHVMKAMFGVSRSQGIHFGFMAKLILLVAFSNFFTVPDLLKWRNAFLDFPMRFSNEIFVAMGSRMEIMEMTPDPANLLGTKARFDDIFDKFDRYVLKMLGVEDKEIRRNLNSKLNPAETKAISESTFIGLAALVGGLFFAGDIGFLLTMSTIGFLIVILLAMAQATLFYCTIVIAVNFLIAISPITITCIIFGPTKSITRTWFQYIIVYVTQPLMLMACIALTLGVLQSIVSAEPVNLYSPLKSCHANSEVRKLADGTPAACSIFEFTGKNIKKKLQNSTQKTAFGLPCDSLSGQVLNISSFSPTASAVSSATVGDDVTARTQAMNDYAAESFKTACMVFQNTVQLDSSNMFMDRPDLIANLNTGQSGYLSEEHITQELLAHKMAVLILFVMLISFLKALPDMVSKMVGVGVIPALTNYSGGVVRGVEGATSSLSGSIRNTISSAFTKK